MQRNQLAGAATIGVGAILITNALLGPLALGVIRFRESAEMETQLLGGEMTSLFLAGPLAIVAGVSWWRGGSRAPLLAMGPLGYAVYMGIQMVLVPDYTQYAGNNERFFPLYLLLIMASWIVAFEGWRELKATRLPAPSPRTARLLGAMLLGVNVVFSLAWWMSIAATYAFAPSAEYRAHPTAFWLIRLMDLGFVLPVGMVTGLGLLARKSWASRLAYAFVGTQTLLACAVAGMAVRMWLADGGVNGGIAVVMVVVATAFVVMYAGFVAPGRGSFAALRMTRFS